MSLQKSPGSLSKDEKTACSTGPHFRNFFFHLAYGADYIGAYDT